MHGVLKMQKTLLSCSLAVVFGFASFAVAQDETATADGAKASQEQAKSNLEEAAEMTQIIMSKMLLKAGLDGDQTSKVDAILKANVKDMVFKRDELTKFLSKEQQQTYNAAMKMAKKAKYDKDKAEDYSLRKLKLKPEQIDAYKKLKMEVDGINRKIFVSIGQIMTPEQLEKVPMFKEMMPKAESTTAGSATKGGSGAKAGSDAKAGSEKKN